MSKFSAWLSKKLRKYCGFEELYKGIDEIKTKISIVEQKTWGGGVLNKEQIESLFSNLSVNLVCLNNSLNDFSNHYSTTEAISCQKSDIHYYDLMSLLSNLTQLPQSFSVRADACVAYESNDHKVPRGTKNDNTRHLRFVVACERHFPERKIKHIDLGCAGGGLVLDFLLRGHESIGLEGSDYSQKSARATWRLLDGNNLFTTDITKPFEIFIGKEIFQADVITAWELMEHIRETDMRQLFDNIKKHLLPNGYFIGSIAMFDDIGDGLSYHPTVKPYNWWVDKFSEYGFFLTEKHSFTIDDFCRGSGNGAVDWNVRINPEKGFHFVSELRN
ncbi:MAG: class I SAM-dependent methyltransferase [Synergistaceae bacterium]|jgi:hypothetical protein|nr:class I SAM-dependent methyltransferase [Synergistaceae bacterium]